jgi:hypothetical protein
LEPAKAAYVDRAISAPVQELSNGDSRRFEPEVWLKISESRKFLFRSRWRWSEAHKLRNIKTFRKAIKFLIFTEAIDVIEFKGHRNSQPFAFRHVALHLSAIKFTFTHVTQIANDNLRRTQI